MSADEVMQQYAAAWSRSDENAAFEFYADDVVMHLPGRGRLAGDHTGKDAVTAAIKALLGRTDDASVEVEVLDRFVSETAVAMQVREVVTRKGRTLDFRRVAVYRLRDDKIVDIDIYDAHQYDVDEFFG